MRERRFELPAGTFHAVEVGEGRPLVFLHGFPDHPLTAHVFLGELAGRGYRVLAQWLPGYAPSPPVERYDVISLAGHVRSVIDAWSPDDPVDVVGHDWGAVLAYALCIRAPERLRRVVTLAVPHPLTFVRQLRKPSQLARSWYMLLFQLPGSSWLVRRPGLSVIDKLWRAWSPRLALPEADREALVRCLARSLPEPLEYYRAMRRDPTPVIRFFREPIATPVLALHGADDGCILPPPLAAPGSRADQADRRRFTGPYERAIVDGLGHFLHLEDPHDIAERAAGWLAGATSPVA
jgi:pimeloyl-ACP methyl ester carboxylesterase